jgi:filamentous hemagglutinin family protein
MQYPTILTIAPLSLLALSLAIAPARAQIVPSPTNAPGSTGTIVTPGSETLITGGQTSGTNLFHSFSQFGLTQGQVANFQTAAEIKNVLARINGGDPSVIDGLLKLTGSNASLYLMNPAGVILGDNAKVHVPSSFVVTTATNIGIGNGLFNAIGPNDYTSLASTPSSFVFQPGARGAIVNTAISLAPANLFPPGYNPTNNGENRTFAFIGHTILDLIGLSLDGNVALFAVPENASLNFFGSNTQSGIIDLNTIVKPKTNETILNLPTFSAFNIPSFTELAALSRQAGNSLYGVLSTDSELNTITMGDKNSGIIRSGDTYSYRLSGGSAFLISDQNIIIGNGINTTNRIKINSNTIQFTADKTSAIAEMSTSGIKGKTVEIFATGNIDIPTYIEASSSIRIETAGDLRVGGLGTVMPNGTARSTADPSINIRANSVQVTDARYGVVGIANDPPVSMSEIYGPSEALRGRFSILTNGSISIEQTGNGTFVEGAALERDASGSVVYRLASNPDTRVTIASVKIPEDENLIPYTHPMTGTIWLRNTITGALIPDDGSTLVLKNVATDELIQGDRVIVRLSDNPASLDGGGTQGLIGRVDKSSGLLVELSGTTKPVLPEPFNTQHPAMISITSKTGGTSLANPIGGPIPGSYSNVPGLASTVKTPLPTQIPVPIPQQAVIPTTPAPVPSTPIETPAIPPVPIATKSIAPPEVILYHRPILSSNATRGTLDTGILKIEIDPREEGILTLYRQPTLEKETLETVK